MKRYLLLAGDYYEAEGWAELFRGDFDTVEEAQCAISGPRVGSADWFEIVDTDTKKIVEAGTVYRWLRNREG